MKKLNSQQRLLIEESYAQIRYFIDGILQKRLPRSVHPEDLYSCADELLVTCALTYRGKKEGFLPYVRVSLRHKAFYEQQRTRFFNGIGHVSTKSQQQALQELRRYRFNGEASTLESVIQPEECPSGLEEELFWKILTETMKPQELLLLQEITLDSTSLEELAKKYGMSKKSLKRTYYKILEKARSKPALQALV